MHNSTDSIPQQISVHAFVLTVAHAICKIVPFTVLSASSGLLGMSGESGLLEMSEEFRVVVFILMLVAGGYCVYQLYSHKRKKYLQASIQSVDDVHKTASEYAARMKHMTMECHHRIELNDDEYFEIHKSERLFSIKEVEEVVAEVLQFPNR